MSVFKSGPKDGISLDGLENVTGFVGVGAGNYLLKNLGSGLYTPEDVNDVRLRLGLGLEYVEGKLEVKVKDGVSRINLTDDGLMGHPNLYQLNFANKSLTNGFNFSVGDAEGYSYCSYVVPIDSLLLGGSCICVKNEAAFGGECKARVLYNGVDTEMVLQKDVGDISGLVLFNPRILVKAGSLLGLKAVDNVNGEYTGYSVYLTTLPTISATVKVRNCVPPVSVVEVSNPELPVDTVDVSEVVV